MCSISDKRAAIIIPAYNRKTVTLGCLSRLEKIGALEKYSVVVVDSGSSDGTRNAIAKRFSSVDIIEGSEDLWWTGAIALGMQYAYQRGSSHIIWMNDDCYVNSDVFESLIETCNRFSTSRTSDKGAIVGAQGYDIEKPDTVGFGGKRKTWAGFRFLSVTDSRIQACDLLSGNLVCMPRQIIEAVGYPDENITPHYGGDSLYLLKASSVGFCLFVDTRHTVFDSRTQASPLYPTCWIAAEGGPLRLIQLACTPQSGLSWRVWLHLNWEAYGLWGWVLFSKKYISILLITLLRYLPLSLRQQLSSGF